jgi:hypothetical protein
MVKTMEGSHDPQLPVISTPPVSAAPPTLPAQPVPAPIAPPAKRPGRFLVFRRVTRLLVRRWLYAMTILFRWLRPVAGFLVTIVALLGVIGWLAAKLWWPAGEVSKDVRVAPLVPAPAVEHYIQGQQSFNADLMWESLSPAAQASRLENGVSKDVMQVQANRQRLGGVQYRHYDYIGGVKLKDGGSMYFYAVDLDTPQGSGKLPFTFVADSDGKVQGVIAPQY